MAVDLAHDVDTGDLVAAPSNDVAVYRGEAVVAQRMRVRLRVQVGSWSFDETLGSRLHDATRLPTPRALTEIPLMVKEALAPMEDVQVIDVTASYDENSPRSVGFTVVYRVVDSFGGEGEPQEFSGLIPVSG